MAGFVASSGQGNPMSAHGIAHLLEDVMKFAVSINDDCASDTCMQETILKELSCAMSTVVLLDRGDDDGGAEVAHLGNDADVIGK